jgi:diguanylate cyclase (GGDEF)-like protein
MAARFTLEKALGSLIVLTLIAILAERPLLETRMTLGPSDGQLSVYADSYEGGKSQAWIVDPNGMEWICDMIEEHRFPYCGFEFILANDRQSGIDLSRYDHIRLWLDYQGPTETLRVYLRNYDPAYSDPQQNDTTKYNQVEFNASRTQKGPIEFSMKDFFVANWWLVRYRIPPEQGRPQFDNIVVLEIQTGLALKYGEHRFRLQKVELTGQLLTTAQWYQIITGVWLMAALMFFIVRLKALQAELKRKTLREQELTEINNLLDARSRDLEEKARLDPLTGAFNRQGLEEAMMQGLTEWRNEAKPLSIVMLDLDHFKQINDTYGHAAGDQVLSKVSALVQANIRSQDVFARWGGEEFVLVCRNTRLQEASLLAEKLRELIADTPLGPDGQVRASFGVATLRANETLEQIFARVDQALYQAKRSGRNRVQVSPAVA